MNTMEITQRVSRKMPTKQPLSVMGYDYFYDGWAYEFDISFIPQRIDNSDKPYKVIQTAIALDIIDTMYSPFDGIAPKFKEIDKIEEEYAIFQSASFEDCRQFIERILNGEITYWSYKKEPRQNFGQEIYTEALKTIATQ